MVFCIQMLSKKLMKLRAKVETPFLFKCSLRVLRQAVSILLVSTIRISSSFASFLRDLFKTSMFLLIHCWSVRVVSDDRAIVVCEYSYFASEIIVSFIPVSPLNTPQIAYVLNNCYSISVAGFPTFSLTSLARRLVVLFKCL